MLQSKQIIFFSLQKFEKIIFRIATYHKAKFLQKRFLELPKIIEKLHDSNKPMWSKKINDFGINVQNLITQIKVGIVRK
jgi:hypothetical protein